MPRNLPLTGNRTECTTCLECFNSESAFDRHLVSNYDYRKSTRRCLTVPQMIAKGFTTNPKGYWIRSQRRAGTLRRKPATEAAPATTVATAPCEAL